MYLKTMKLHNFRCFSDLEVTFQKNTTVIVGNNGAGKSTVLEAAAIAVGTLTSAMDGLTNYNIKKSDAHYKYFSIGSVIDVQQQFPVQISTEAVMDDKLVQWTRSLNSAKARTNFAGAKELVQIANEIQQRLRNGDISLRLPLIAYYGTGRLWNQYAEKKNEVFDKNSRSNGYADSLDGAANDKLMKRWFQKMTIQQYQQEKSFPEFEAVCNAMAQCFKSITGCSDVNVQFNLDTNEIDIVYKNISGESIRMPMNQLSDGYKCTISLIADIAYRMALLNPQFLDKVLVETEGVVLIDEIDLHLHPIWQQQILQDLREIFPRIQFIVSTHAPAIINSVQSECLVVLKDNDAFGVSNETYGKDTNTILREVMGVPERPKRVKEQFNEFYRVLDEQNYEKAQQLLDELETILGGNDVELTECRVRLELEQM